MWTSKSGANWRSLRRPDVSAWMVKVRTLDSLTLASARPTFF